MDVRMPDGTVISGVPDDITQSELIRRYQKYAAEPKFDPIPEEPGFFKALGTGASSTLKSLAPAAKLMVNPGDEQAAQQMQQVQKEAQDAYRRTQFSDIGARAKAGDIGGALGATWDKFRELSGESIGFQAPAAAAGLLGAGAAAVAGAPAALIGTGAYGLTLLGQYIASNLGRQVEENKGKPVDRLPATVAGGGQAALDLLGGKFLGLGKLLGIEGKAVADQTVKELALAAANPVKYKQEIAKGVMKGIAFEIPQEVSQQVLERWQAGLATNPYDDPEAAKEYAEAAAGALMLGGPLGAVGQVGAARAGRGNAQEELGRRAAIEDTQRKQLLAEAENAPRSEVFTGMGPEGKPVPNTAQQEMMDREQAPPPDAVPDLFAYTPGGDKLTAERFNQDPTEEITALQTQLEEQRRVLDILDREVQRAKTPGEKVKFIEQQEQIKSAIASTRAQINTLNKQINPTNPEKEPTRRQSMKQMAEVQPQLQERPAPTPEPLQYPAAPEVPTPVGMQITDDVLTGLGFSRTSKKARDTLRGLDLTRADDLNKFEGVLGDISGRVKFNPEVASNLIDKAREQQIATKGRMTQGQVLGETPAAQNTDVQELEFAKQRRDAGMPLTPRQEYLLKQQQPQTTAELEVAQAQERKTPGLTLAIQQGREKRRRGTQAPAVQPEPTQEPAAEPVLRGRPRKSMPRVQGAFDFEGTPNAGREADSAGMAVPVQGRTTGGGAADVTRPADVDGDQRDAGRSDGATTQQSSPLTPPSQKPKRGERTNFAEELFELQEAERLIQTTKVTSKYNSAVLYLVDSMRDQNKAVVSTARSILERNEVPQQDIDAAKQKLAASAAIQERYEANRKNARAVQQQVDDENAEDDLLLPSKPVGVKVQDDVAAAVQAGDLRKTLRGIIQSTNNPLLKQVAQRLLARIGNTRIKVGMVEGAGQYDPTTDTITISPDSLHEHTILHETTHAAISHVLRSRMHPLTRQLNELFTRIRPRIEGQYGATSLQEFAAEAQSNSEFQQMLRSIRIPQGALKTAYDWFVNAVRKFFGMSPRSSNTALDRIDEIIGKIIRAGKTIPKTPGDILFLNADVSGASAAYRNMLNTMGDSSTNLPKFSGAWSDVVGKMSRGVLGAAVKTLDLNHLVEIYGNRAPALRGVVDLLNERRGYENTQIDRAGQTAKSLQRVVNKYSQTTALKKEYDKFTEVVYDATLARFDPADPKNSGNPAAKQGPDLLARYKALPDDLKKSYTEIKEHYEKLYKDYIAALEKDLAVLPKNEIDEIKAGIESKIKPYFPLMRFGDYWMRFEKNGEQIVMAFETPEQRNRFIAENKIDRNSKDFKQYKNLDEVIAGRTPPSDPMIQRTLRAMRDNGVADDVVNDVYKALLRLNPQQSAIMNMIKREGRAGFEKDVLRSYTATAPKLISQTASRLYNRRIEETAALGRNELADISSKDPRGFDPLADEVATQISAEPGSRLTTMLNPTINKLASNINWLTFSYFLGANVSTALINLTQTPMIAYPMMASKYGAGKATAALMGAYKAYGKSVYKNAGDNFKKFGYLSPLNTLPKDSPLRGLYDELQRRGQINISISQEILDMRSQPSSPDSKVKRAASIAMTFAYQHSEMANREITAIAAYTLAKQKGLSETEAVNEAVDMITKSHGSGMMETAGPIFQHPLGRVVLIFKRFAQLMMFRTARMAYVAIKGDSSLSPQERELAKNIARKQLLGTYAMTFAFAGAQGLPFVGVGEFLYNVFQSAFGDDDEYPDFRNTMRNALGEFTFKGPTNYLTGLEVAQRTGFGDLLIRDDSRSKAELGALRYYIEQIFLGAPFSILTNMNRAAQMIDDGYWYRGIEAGAPAALRNGLKAMRFGVEGATTLKGDPITDDINIMNAMFQLGGFAPTKLTEIYEKRGYMKEMETFVRDRKRRLFDQYETAADAGDVDALMGVQERIAAFNMAFPEVAIKPKDIIASVKGRDRREQQAIYGVQIDPKLKERVRKAAEGEE